MRAALEGEEDIASGGSVNEYEYRRRRSAAWVTASTLTYHGHTYAKTSVNSAKSHTPGHGSRSLARQGGPAALPAGPGCPSDLRLAGCI